MEVNRRSCERDSYGVHLLLDGGRGEVEMGGWGEVRWTEITP